MALRPAALMEQLLDQATGKRPNVIWIFGDQHRAQALGCAGDPNVRTPNIDRLAAEGVTFTQAVSGCPLCAPYRGALLTGRYPHQSVPGHEYPLPEGMPTIAEPFNQAGYRTAYFGKWHIDGFHERTGRAAFHTVPQSRRGGFGTWLGYENNNSPWDSWIHGHNQAGSEVEHTRLDGFETDALTDRLIGYVGDRAADASPFFAVLSVQPPHNPYAAPERWMARHAAADLELRPNVPAIPRVVEEARRELVGYYAMIENLDWNLGRLRQALADACLADDTQIIFFSDHGDMHGSHGQFRKTCPWEESIRVPFIIGGGRLYGQHGQGQRRPVPINHVDIGATSLGLCGIDAPQWMVGTDYAGYRVPGRPVRDEPDSAYLQLVVPTGHGHSVDRPWRGVVTRDGWKYIVLEHQPWLMFDLNEDPYEQANLAHNRAWATRRSDLHDRLIAWMQRLDDPFPGFF